MSIFKFVIAPSLSLPYCSLKLMKPHVQSQWRPRRITPEHIVRDREHEK